MSGKVVFEKGSTGKFHFNLRYESKESALHGIESVKHNAADAVIEDLTEE